MEFSFLLNFIIHEDNVLENTDKNYSAKQGGADKGGREGWGNADNG